MFTSDAGTETDGMSAGDWQPPSEAKLFPSTQLLSSFPTTRRSSSRSSLRLVLGYINIMPFTIMQIKYEYLLVVTPNESNNGLETFLIFLIRLLHRRKIGYTA